VFFLYPSNGIPFNGSVFPKQDKYCLYGCDLSFSESSFLGYSLSRTLEVHINTSHCTTCSVDDAVISDCRKLNKTSIVHINVTLRCFHATIVAVKSNMLHNLCVFVALGIQLAMLMHHIVICGLHRSAVFFHIISYMAGFKRRCY
jgi:hypothetical protein